MASETPDRFETAGTDTAAVDTVEGQRLVRQVEAADDVVWAIETLTAAVRDAQRAGD